MNSLSRAGLIIPLILAVATGIWLNNTAWRNRRLIWQLQAAVIAGKHDVNTLNAGGFRDVDQRFRFLTARIHENCRSATQGKSQHLQPSHHQKLFSHHQRAITTV